MLHELMKFDFNFAFMEYGEYFAVLKKLSNFISTCFLLTNRTKMVRSFPPRLISVRHLDDDLGRDIDG